MTAIYGTLSPKLLDVDQDTFYATLPRYGRPSLKDVPGEVRRHVKLPRKLVEVHEKPIDTWQGQGFRLRHVNQVTATTSYVAISSRTNCEVDRQEPNLRHVNQGTTATAFIAINSRTNSEVDRQEPNLRHANQGTRATSFVARRSCSNGEVNGQDPTEGNRNRNTSQTLRLVNQITAATCCVAIGSRTNRRL